MIWFLDKTVFALLAVVVFLSFILGYDSTTSGVQVPSVQAVSNQTCSFNSSAVKVVLNSSCNSNDFSNSLVVPLVAVSSSGGGEVVNLTIVEKPGFGRSFFQFGLSSPMIANETQVSFSDAVEVARNFDAQTLAASNNVDLYYFFDSNVSGVDGDSAGLGAAVGTVLLLKNESFRSGVGVTGGVFLNGSVIQVGGVLDKAEALKSAGFSEFVVPVGESVVNVTENSSVQNCSQTIINGQVFNECSPVVSYNVVPESVESVVGINVVEVSDVRQAYAQLVGS